MNGILRYWPGDFGLPSFDRESLLVLTYAKINKCKISYEIGQMPYWKPMPAFYDRNEHVHTNVNDIMIAILNTLSDQLDTDRKHYTSQLVNIQVFKQYITDELEIALLLTFWNDETNYENLTRAFYSAVILFPFNRLYLKRMKAKAEEKLMFLSGKISMPIFIELKVERINQCLLDLSSRLGENKYFMGDYPSSLDAVVYSYLAPIYYAPCKSCVIKNKLSALENLTSFVVSMSRTYFPEIEVTYKYFKPLAEDDGTPVWQILLAGCFAGGAMFMFAYLHGIYRVGNQ